MFKRLILAAAAKLIDSIDWDSLLEKLLVRLEEEVKEQIGIEVSLTSLDRTRLWATIEEAIKDTLGLSIDLDDNGTIGKQD